MKELEEAKDEENATNARAKADATPKDPPTPALKEDTESAVVFKEPEQDSLETQPPAPSLLPAATKLSDVEAAAQADTPDVRPRFVEKKRLVWSNKTCGIYFYSSRP